MVKVGGKAGIPVHVGLTSVEREINDTNKRWQHLRAGGPMLELRTTARPVKAG